MNVLVAGGGDPADLSSDDFSPTVVEVTDLTHNGLYHGIAVEIPVVPVTQMEGRRSSPPSIAQPMP